MAKKSLEANNQDFFGESRLYFANQQWPQVDRIFRDIRFLSPTRNSNAKLALNIKMKELYEIM